MAELNSLLLTVSHDLDQTQGLISLDSSSGEEAYTLLRNEEVTCKPGDMVMSDQQGAFCSVIYGQDSRTRITEDTQRVLYTVYVPPDIDVEVIELHLKDLEQNVNLAFLQAKTTHQDIYHASPASD